jgi:hypothetical protein
MCAQVKIKIKKGRRNKPESQFMLDKNYFEADWEVGHEKITSDIATTVYPNLLLRYGISKRLEFNTEINFITATDKYAQPKNTNGIEPIMLGTTYLLVAETKLRPAIILSAQLAIPYLASKNFTANYTAPTLQVTIEKPVKKNILLALSTGVFWDGFLPTPSFIYNAAIGYNITKKWMLTSEWFGFINGMLRQQNTDISVAYTINKSIQLGATAGIGISAAAHKNYIAINGVWGCSLKKKKRRHLINTMI